MNRKIRTWVEISLNDLEHNYREISSRLPDGCQMLGVCKANAYGHGAVPVARELEALGASYLAVSNIDECEEVRRGGVCGWSGTAQPFSTWYCIFVRGRWGPRSFGVGMAQPPFVRIC